MQTFSSSEQLLANTDITWKNQLLQSVIFEVNYFSSQKVSLLEIWTFLSKTCAPRATASSGKQFVIRRISFDSLVFKEVHQMYISHKKCFGFRSIIMNATSSHRGLWRVWVRLPSLVCGLRRGKRSGFSWPTKSLQMLLWTSPWGAWQTCGALWRSPCQGGPAVGGGGR